MTTIVIRPKNKAEKNFIARLLRMMNIETQFVEESDPNIETRKAMIDVENKKGTRVKDSRELFTKLDI